MYLRKIRIERIKLLRDLRLEFVREDQPRMWTVLVGQNGLCKTSILRAIGLAASGRDRANQLAQDLIPSLRDVRSPDHLAIRAEFGFGNEGDRRHREYPPPHPTAATPDRLYSNLYLGRDRHVFEGESSYDEAGVSHEKIPISFHSGDRSGGRLGGLPRNKFDPLGEARAMGYADWFVAGYGVNRSLPRPQSVARPEDVVRTRLESLFDRGTLTSTGFADHFNPEGSRVFAEALKATLLKHKQLLPMVRNFDLAREGTTPNDNLLLSHQFYIETGDRDVRLPATWLSHGYQATIAWLADVVGHLLWEGSGGISPPSLPPELMEGLVLIDELDLHLHPSWQVGLISALKLTFPRLQFIVTTHSSLLLAGLEADEIVMLEQDPNTGDVVAKSSDRTPKLSSNSDLLAHYFGVNQLYPINLSKQLYRYGLLASDPNRNDAEDAEAAQIYAELERAGVAPEWKPVERAP